MLKFLVGIACGIGVGLLVAPAPGEEIRARLAEAARRPGDLAREKVQEAREDIAQVGANPGRQVAEKAVDKVLPETLKEKGRRRA
ncbi:MAG TPA: YtxH domain-containing protein [Terriglobales bacterium]|nr:YtxH domain-containing protein [Terriglobales bacterium]